MTKVGVLLLAVICLATGGLFGLAIGVLAADKIVAKTRPSGDPIAIGDMEKTEKNERQQADIKSAQIQSLTEYIADREKELSRYNNLLFEKLGALRKVSLDDPSINLARYKSLGEQYTKIKFEADAAKAYAAALGDKLRERETAGKSDAHLEEIKIKAEVDASKISMQIGAIEKELRGLSQVVYSQQQIENEIAMLREKTDRTNLDIKENMDKIRDLKFDRDPSSVAAMVKQLDHLTAEMAKVNSAIRKMPGVREK
jgi:hypothetical protein